MQYSRKSQLSGIWQPVHHRVWNVFAVLVSTSIVSETFIYSLVYALLNLNGPGILRKCQSCKFYSDQWIQWLLTPSCCCHDSLYNYYDPQSHPMASNHYQSPCISPDSFPSLPVISLSPPVTLYNLPVIHQSPLIINQSSLDPTVIPNHPLWFSMQSPIPHPHVWPSQSSLGAVIILPLPT